MIQIMFVFAKTKPFPPKIFSGQSPGTKDGSVPPLNFKIYQWKWFRVEFYWE